MKKIVLLSTAATLIALQASAQDYRQGYSFKLEEPAQKAGPGFGTIALGALLAGGAIAAMAGGGGGGGGGDSDSNDGNTGDGGSSPTPDPGDGPYRGETAPREGFNTSEYRRNWGIDAINADARYAQGGTGLGALSAVFDTGIDVTHQDLDDQIVFTRSYYGSGTDVTDSVGHGTIVGGIIAAEKNNVGTHGVAYDSKLAVFQGLGGTGGMTMDFMSAWSDATRTAADLGATVINHSWNFVDGNDVTLTVDQLGSRSAATTYFGTDFLEALEYAVDKDMISVFAAGNSGLDSPGNQAALGLYFPEYSDHVLTVVAIDENDNIASFSNRCGIAAEICLAAPGVDIISTMPGDSLGLSSGTSMAAPHVDGAIILMASNFPELTGAEITRILKDTARDLGAPGIDEVYGNGALDLENAIAPQGTISFQVADRIGTNTHRVADSHISASGGMASALASAFAGQKIIVTDGYDRAYATSMDVFVGSGEDISRDRQALLSYTGGRDGALRLQGDGTELNWSARDTSALAGAGVIDADISAPYASLLENAGAMRYNTWLGGTRVSFSGAAGTSADTRASGHYYALEASAPLGAHDITLGVGQLSEDQAFLGTDVSGAFGDGLDTQTSLVSLKGDIALGGGKALTLSGAIGSSYIDGNGMIEGGRIVSRSLGLGYDARNALRKGDRFQLSLSQSMAVTGGHLDIRVPTGLAAAQNGERSDKVAMSSTSLQMGQADIAPVDLKIGYEFPLHSGRLALGAALRQGDVRHRVASIGYTLHF